MLRIIKVGGVVVGSGVAVGLLVVGWMYLSRPETLLPQSSGNPVVLDTSTTPTAPQEDVLQVAGPSPAANALPSSNNFRQYEAHQGKPTALFIDVFVGQGKDIAVGSQANVMYRGWLTDGTLFDENYTRGQAFAFKEGDKKVIPGWEEGLFGMKAGGKRRLIIPASRAYGSEIHGPIPANSMLIFDIELVKVD